MTLEEAIEQAEKTYKESRSAWLYALKRGETRYKEQCSKSMDYNRQLIEWLRELAERRRRQSEYEPVTAEDLAKTMSENTAYRFVTWHSEALTLMEGYGFVICKRKTI